MTQRITTVAKHKSAIRERRLRDVAHLVEKGCTLDQIAKKFRIDVATAEDDKNEVIQRWADRTGEEWEMLAVRVQQQTAIGRRCVEEFDRRRRETTTTHERCEQCRGEGFFPGAMKACPECGGTGRIETTVVVKMARGDAQLLTLAQKCFAECAKLEGLCIQRKELRESQGDQVDRSGRHLHQHVHIESNPFADNSSEDLVAAQTMLGRLLKGVDGALVVEEVTEAREKSDE